MKKKDLLILTVLGYGWMTGFGWCEAPETGRHTDNGAVLEEKDDPSMNVLHKTANVITHPISGEVKAVSGIRSPLFIQDSNQQQTTENISPDRVAPPPPTNLRIIIRRE